MVRYDPAHQGQMKIVFCDKDDNVDLISPVSPSALNGKTGNNKNTTKANKNTKSDTNKEINKDKDKGLELKPISLLNDCNLGMSILKAIKQKYKRGQPIRLWRDPVDLKKANIGNKGPKVSMFVYADVRSCVWNYGQLSLCISALLCCCHIPYLVVH